MKSFIILFIFAFSAVLAETEIDPECPIYTQSDNATILPNTNDCTKFWICDAGRVKQAFDCPCGLLFNPELNVCDWPYNVACDQEPVSCVLEEEEAEEEAAEEEAAEEEAAEEEAAEEEEEKEEEVAEEEAAEEEAAEEEAAEEEAAEEEDEKEEEDDDKEEEEEKEQEVDAEWGVEVEAPTNSVVHKPKKDGYYHPYNKDTVGGHVVHIQNF